MILGPGKTGTRANRWRAIPGYAFAAAGFAACLMTGPPGLATSHTVAAAAAAAAAWSGSAQLTRDRADACQPIRRELTPDRLGLRSDADAWRATLQFYDTRSADASWWTDTGPSSAAHELARIIRNARGLDGLDPDAYGAATLAELFEAPRAIHAPDWPRCFADFALTYRLALYATDLARGRVSPRDVAFPTETDLRPEQLDITPIFEQAISARDVAGALDRVRPTHPWYGMLVAELARYRAIAATGGWPSIPQMATLEPNGQADAALVLTLGRRLAREGYLGPAATPRLTSAAGSLEVTAVDAGPLPYNRVLVEAVQRFQAHHGLEVDGILGTRTREALNVPVEARVRSIEVTLDHIRWLPRDASEALVVVVNVAGFELHTVESRRVTLRLRTIVGNRGWKTPLLSSTLTELVVNPDWNIPASITRLEIVPKILREAGYLNREAIAVLDARTGATLDPAAVDWSAVRAGDGSVRLRQAPGPLNPLGDVKFGFPSRFGVYLHDTNAPTLFEQPARALSHGCMRLDRPFELVKRLEGRLAGSWSFDRVEAVASGASLEIVPLEPGVPIHVVYWTATIGPDGGIRFHDDVYRVEAATREALVRSGPGPS